MVGPPSTEMFTAAFSIVGIFVAAVFAAPWLMRKVNRDLVKAQAVKTDREADEILDRQAGVWIKRYEDRLAELDEYMDRQDEYHAIHAAWDFNVMTACRHAGVDIPDPPPLKPPRKARTRKTHGHTRIEYLDQEVLEGDG